jgi:hypothetical protein
MVREKGAQPPPYPAAKARGLKSCWGWRWPRIAFFGEFALPVALLLALMTLR